MSALDRKRRGELLRSVFDVLIDHSDGLAAKEVLREVEGRLGLTDHEAANYPGTETRRFEKTVRFQTINAVKAGWMVKEGGIWTPTEDGVAAHSRYSDPEQFLIEAQRLYKEWEATQPAPEQSSQEEESEEEISDASLTLERAEEAAWEQVRTYLSKMDPYDFQHLVAGLLRGMGYDVTWVAPPGKDRGVDIQALGDPLGTKGPRVKVQVKREQSKSDAPTLRAFASVLHEGDVGVFVTLGGFTSDAEAEVRDSARRIRLIGPFQLFELWARYYESMTAEDRRRLPVKFVPFLIPEGRASE
jgi:restriction system protein